VNRLLKSLPLFLVAAILSCLSAQAQNCAAWTNVIGFTGNFSLTASGTNVSAPGRLDSHHE
jgi:hypothetical protein